MLGRMTKTKHVQNAPVSRKILRIEAGAAYAVGTMTIPELQNDARFESIPVRTLERWSRIDRWVERRATILGRAKEAADVGAVATGTAFDAEVGALLEIQRLALERLRAGLYARDWRPIVTAAFTASKRLSEIALAQRRGRRDDRTRRGRRSR